MKMTRSGQSAIAINGPAGDRIARRLVSVSEPRRRRGLVLCLGLVAAAAGCEAKSPWETTVPVAGSVTLNDQPIAGAQVTLYPLGSEVPTSVRPSATTDREGRFKIGTYSRDDGAPVGKYNVAIIWHPLVNSASGPVRGDNKLPPRYARPETSGVSASVDTAGGTLPPFALKK